MLESPGRAALDTRADDPLGLERFQLRVAQPEQTSENLSIVLAEGWWRSRVQFVGQWPAREPSGKSTVHDIPHDGVVECREPATFVKLFDADLFMGQ